MPRTTERVLTGADGHTRCTVTEWDYDRAGGAYAITCECGWQSQSHWSWKDATDEHDKHGLFVQRQADSAALTDAELAERLRAFVKGSISGPMGWGTEHLLEAADRLANR